MFQFGVQRKSKKVVSGEAESNEKREGEGRRRDVGGSCPIKIRGVLTDLSKEGGR